MRSALLSLAGLLGALASCGPDSCESFVDDTTSCYDSYCSAEGADTAFCGCWNQGMDISLIDCTCVPLDLSAACDLYDLSDYKSGDLDCTAATDAVGNMCAS